MTSKPKAKYVKSINSNGLNSHTETKVFQMGITRSWMQVIPKTKSITKLKIKAWTKIDHKNTKRKQGCHFNIKGD